MGWNVNFHDKFKDEFHELSMAVQDKIFELVTALEELGPDLGRPRVDTLSGSKHSNMKELRFSVDGGVWRVAFIFDPNREAILLVAGNKAGNRHDRRFYRGLREVAERRYDEYLASIKGDRNHADPA